MSQFDKLLQLKSSETRLKVRKITMKSMDEYLSLPYRLEIIPDREEGGFTAWYPELPGCVTCADTMERLIANAEEAKRIWLEAALQEGLEIAEPTSEDVGGFSGNFKLHIPRSLHRSLSMHAKREGISMNQYCTYLLAKYDSITARSEKPVQ